MRQSIDSLLFLVKCYRKKIADAAQVLDAEFEPIAQTGLAPDSSGAVQGVLEPAAVAPAVTPTGAAAAVGGVAGAAAAAKSGVISGAGKAISGTLGRVMLPLMVIQVGGLLQKALFYAFQTVPGCVNLIANNCDEMLKGVASPSNNSYLNMLKKYTEELGDRDKAIEKVRKEYSLERDILSNNIYNPNLLELMPDGEEKEARKKIAQELLDLKSASYGLAGSAGTSSSGIGNEDIGGSLGWTIARIKEINWNIKADDPDFDEKMKKILDTGKMLKDTDKELDAYFATASKVAGHVMQKREGRILDNVSDTLGADLGRSYPERLAEGVRELKTALEPWRSNIKLIIERIDELGNKYKESLAQKQEAQKEQPQKEEAQTEPEAPASAPLLIRPVQAPNFDHLKDIEF